MKPEIDIVRCFVEHPDYFQGASQSTFVGMGDTALSAFDDAIELCASGDRDSEGKEIPDDIEWPGRTEQEQLLREAHCDPNYALSADHDPNYEDAEDYDGEDYNTPSIYLLIKVYV